MGGFRLQPQESRKERLRSLEAELKNSQMALKISQMMTQQMMQNMKNLSQDVGKAFNLINEMQYKLIAVQKISGLDISALATVADELRLKDFQEASDKEDKEENYTAGTTVDENSLVILTSKTNPQEGQADAGIFRSKIKLSTCGVPDLITAFLGKEVGTKATVKLNEQEHEIELLAIRQPPAATPVEQEPTAPQA
jgi:hypothetical protein